MSHTPGPWTVAESGSRFRHLNDPMPELFGTAEDTCILTVEGEYEVLGCSEWLRAERDDLLLMAAAPDLLEALKEILNEVEHMHRADRERALAAIAKAEGRGSSPPVDPEII